jgi:hypothetical protein
VTGSPPALRALFQQRVAGDSALLELAGLRFAQAGMGAEVYADTPEHLDRVLGFVPPYPHLPTVHLDRGVNVLHDGGRAVAVEFATRFAGRVWGLVVHDKAEMATRTDELVAGLRALDSRLQGPGLPFVFLEYAAGLPPEWFAELAEKVADLTRISFCVDTGHVGIRQARAHLARAAQSGGLGALRLGDPRLPELADAVQDAVATALPAVLELTRRLGAIGKPVHFHLHDGHPLIAGLADHFSFLTQVPVPFTYERRRSLPPLYGPAGLASIVTTAVQACGVERASLMLEIHQVEGRLPLGDAAGLFRHWRDTTNAERMNYWQAVLAENHLLVRAALEQRGEGGLASQSGR